jgi:hypothetical protein
MVKFSMALFICLYCISRLKGKEWGKPFIYLAGCLAVGTLWGTITQGLGYSLNGHDSAAMRGEWSILSNDKTIRPAFMEISWWGWKKRGPFPVRVTDSSMEDDPTFEYLKDGKWITIKVQNYEDGDGEYDNRGFHEY